MPARRKQRRKARIGDCMLSCTHVTYLEHDISIIKFQHKDKKPSSKTKKVNNVFFLIQNYPRRKT